MSTSTRSLRCSCGTLQAEVDTRPASVRGVCYCKDCQAYARFLGPQDKILNSHGGTEIIALLPSAIRFTTGHDQLACATMTDKGPLRWYAACCRTPIGNTPRNMKIAYAALIPACLPGAPDGLDAAFGPLRIALNTGSARGTVKSTPAAALWGMLTIARNVISARLRRDHRRNPFFDTASGLPIRAPQVLTRAQRAALDQA